MANRYYGKLITLNGHPVENWTCHQLLSDRQLDNGLKEGELSQYTWAQYFLFTFYGRTGSKTLYAISQEWEKEMRDIFFREAGNSYFQSNYELSVPIYRWVNWSTVDK